MKNQKQTIRKIVGFLNNPEEEGGFWLPNIQRPFVWGEDQICRLFDSIMREYPISTLLVWKTNSAIRRRKFIDNWSDSLKLGTFYVPEDTKKKSLVLDGQQRLQSLFIGLRGSFNKRELHLNILSGNVSAPDDIKYQFKFLDAAKAEFPWLRFKDLIFTTRKPRQLASDARAAAGRELEEWELEKIEDHIALIDRTFKMDEAVTYQELDSIDNPDLYSEDDVVEVFIRANSGGTKLGKSDLLFSLLTASWDVADDKMNDLLDSLNRHGFAFDRDFVLKTCLVLLGQGARYEVSKFRKDGVRRKIEDEWESISKAVQDVLDFVKGKTYIRCDKAMPTYLVLIPLIDFRYRFPEGWRSVKHLDEYVLRCSVANAFSGQPDNLIDALVRKTTDAGQFVVDDAFDIVRSQGRSLELTEDRFWQMGYGSKTIHLLFNLWYRSVDHTPAYDGNLPQVDHIFPQSQLRKIKALNPKSGRKDLLKYRSPERDQLANCMLLSRDENGARGKGDTLPEEWFADKSADYLDMHLIPRDPELWKIDRFEDFIEARKQLIADRFKWLLAPSSNVATS
ncbi:MAG: GmrSD restriction endonuclease domain-containing protein [Planctomycetota bacterium]|jgi:hypothetical protein